MQVQQKAFMVYMYVYHFNNVYHVVCIHVDAWLNVETQPFIHITLSQKLIITVIPYVPDNVYFSNYPNVIIMGKCHGFIFT